MIGRALLASLATCAALAWASVAISAPADPPADSLRILLDRGRSPEAERMARARLASLDARGVEDTLTARTLDLLMDALLRQGRPSLDEVRALGERAEAMKRRLYGADHAETGRTALRRGILQAVAGDFTAADSSFQRALTLLERALGPEHPDVGLALLQLANRDADDGRDSAAVARYWRAHAIYERALGPDHPRTAQALHNLGIMAKNAGDYVEAKRLYERALAAREKGLPPDHPDIAWTLNNLANVEYELGDFATVERLHRRTLAIRERVQGPDHPDVGYSLINLGNVLTQVGRPREARPFHERGLALFERAHGKEHARVGWALNNLGLTLSALGDHAGARTAYERSLAIREKALGPDHPDVARTLLRLGDALDVLGEHASATPVLERAVAVRERSYGPRHPELAQALDRLAVHYAHLGNNSRAADAAERGKAIELEHFRATIRALEERAALKAFDYRVTAPNVLVSLALRPASEVPDVARRAWDAVIRSRALVLDELAARRRTIAVASASSLARLASDLAAARRELAARVVAGPAGAGADYARTLERAAAVRDSLERALAERCEPLRRQQAAASIGFQEVREALPPEHALVAFTHFDRLASAPPAATASGSPDSSFYVAFVLPPGATEPVVVDLGPTGDIERRVRAWVQEARRQPIGPSAPATERRYRNAAESLRRRVWDPIRSRLGAARRVLIVPDGALHLVSFAALPAPAGRYLVESGPETHLLSAERDLVGLRPGGAGRGLLAFGDPSFEDSPSSSSTSHRGAVAALEPGGPVAPQSSTYRGPHSSCADFRALEFVPLPASRREIEGVAGLWKQGAEGEAALVRVGDAASESDFKRLAPGHRVLHLATHGFFLDAACPRPSSRGDRAAAATISENPLLRAGLALAGAGGRDTRNEGEDGVLTAEEIAALDLGGVEWAVLSACETALGELRAGEGVLGLRRAFQIAGVRSVVMSLWAVDDASTRRWMEALYRERLTRAVETASAVSGAARAVIASRRARGLDTHPFHWGAFVAAGGWR